MDIQISEKFKVLSSYGSYEVTITDESSRFFNVLNECSIILCDSYFKNSKFLHKCTKEIIFIDPVESNKSLKKIEELSELLSSFKLSRNSILGVMGGGIVQDLGGFIASIFMRGIDWNLFPTSYLSMVDSCIGGKTSINTMNTKNLLGTFTPPKKVFCNIMLAETLDDNEIKQGLIESLKITYVFKKYFKNAKFLVQHALKKDIQSLREICTFSLLSKKSIIEKDEFDHNERRLLNIGHTFGHAIEKASNHKISHGFAVGIGILIAFEFSKRNNLCQKKHSILELCLIIETLIPNSIFDLLSLVELNDFVIALEIDKKHDKEYLRFILPTKNFIEVISYKRTELELRKAFSFFNKSNEIRIIPK